MFNFVSSKEEKYFQSFLLSRSLTHLVAKRMQELVNLQSGLSIFASRTVCPFSAKPPSISFIV